MMETIGRVRRNRRGRPFRKRCTRRCRPHGIMPIGYARVSPGIIPVLSVGGPCQHEAPTHDMPQFR